MYWKQTFANIQSDTDLTTYNMRPTFRNNTKHPWTFHTTVSLNNTQQFVATWNSIFCSMTWKNSHFPVEVQTMVVHRINRLKKLTSSFSTKNACQNMSHFSCPLQFCGGFCIVCTHSKQSILLFEIRKQRARFYSSSTSITRDRASVIWCHSNFIMERVRN